MKSYRLLKDASVELEAAVAYYEEKSQGLGLDFLEEFERALELVLEMPDAWSPVDESFRRFLLRRFPYCLFYRLDGELVVVTSIFHQRRRPNIWRSNQ